MSKTIIPEMLFIINVLLQLESIAQENSKKEIKLWFEPQLTKESSLFAHYQSDSWMENGFGYGYGLDYSIAVKDRLWVNAGIGYFGSSNEYKIFNSLVANLEFKLARIPFGVGFELRKWLLINGGLSIDIQYINNNGNYMSNQSGISPYISTCFRYIFSNNIILNLAPRLTHYSIVSFNNDENKDRILTYGVLIGVSKRF